MSIHRPVPSASRIVWVGYARRLALLAVAYNVLESLAALAFGWADHSVALFGFGADSLIEVASSLLVLWRLRGDEAPNGPEVIHRERLAGLWIGLLFLLLAAGTVLGSALQLAAHQHPGTTLPGLAVATLSFGVMGYLWLGKRAAAKALGSRALAGDATCSLICMQLSAVLFLGSLAYWLRPALWWADSGAALVLSFYMGREGVKVIGAVRKADYQGGCGCH